VGCKLFDVRLFEIDRGCTCRQALLIGVGLLYIVIRKFSANSGIKNKELEING